VSKEKVLMFTPYPFEPGQKIHITDGPRKGDWEIVKAAGRKVTLRCPRTKREYEWDRFCYYVETAKDAEWPRL